MTSLATLRRQIRTWRTLQAKTAQAHSTLLETARNLNDEGIPLRTLAAELQISHVALLNQLNRKDR